MYIPSYPINQGWVCPTCGSVYAPWVFSCPSCPRQILLGNTTSPGPVITSDSGTVTTATPPTTNTGDSEGL